MIRDTRRFSNQQYDVLVIGGGINGAAIAHIAASHKKSVALLEKGDFAGGTSSKSTKLVHGGIRYLENFEFGLVREALKERYIQIKSLPHLVRPIPFLVPVYKNDPRPLWMMKLGVSLYDALSGKYTIDRHQQLTVDDVVEKIPGINKEGLLGGVMYYDAQMDDARVCLENILSADSNGAHVANYVEVVSLLKEGGNACGVTARDRLSGETFEVRARKIVCAAGPWSNSLLKLDDPNAKKILRTTKGVHIVLKGTVSRSSLLFMVKKDKRIFFMIPWMGNTLVGTTDTNYVSGPDHVSVTGRDVEYLFDGIRRYFPDMRFKKENIITTFAGLRPLVRRGGSPSKVSRKHRIHKTQSGLIFILGGKYTTYRKIAEDCLKTFMPVTPNEEYLLYGSGDVNDDIQTLADQYGVAPEVVGYLISKYGARYRDVLALAQKHPELKERICSCSPAIKAQIVYSRDCEMAVKPEDIIWRRLSLGFYGCSVKNCEKAIIEAMPL